MLVIVCTKNNQHTDGRKAKFLFFFICRSQELALEFYSFKHLVVSASLAMNLFHSYCAQFFQLN